MFFILYFYSFKVGNNALSESVVRRRPVHVETNKLEKELHQQLQMSLEHVPNAMLTVPVQHPSGGNVALVVCLVDCTEEGNDECTRIVQECFRYFIKIFLSEDNVLKCENNYTCRYCLGLLLTSLRCQEETRLRRQCQELLDVSRKLFKRLGNIFFLSW